MADSMQSALLSLAGRTAKRDMEKRSQYADFFSITAVFLFMVFGTTSMVIGAIYAASNNLDAQSIGFKVVFAGGYVVLAIGGLMALASHWHWFGYANVRDKEANLVNNIPALIGVCAIIAVLSGCAMILCSVFILMKDKTEDTIAPGV